MIKTHHPPTSLVQPNVFRSQAIRWHSSVVTLWTLSKLSPNWCWNRRLPGTFLTLLSFICPARAPTYIKLSSGSSKFASWRTVLLLRMFGVLYLNWGVIITIIRDRGTVQQNDISMFPLMRVFEEIFCSVLWLGKEDFKYFCRLCCKQ